VGLGRIEYAPEFTDTVDAICTNTAAGPESLCCTGISFPSPSFSWSERHVHFFREAPSRFRDPGRVGNGGKY
jgi:hypothetical protein